MEMTSTYLEQAYDKITRWCSSEFRTVGRESNMEASQVMREAVKRLKDRPELLR